MNIQELKNLIGDMSSPFQDISSKEHKLFCYIKNGRITTDEELQKTKVDIEVFVAKINSIKNRVLMAFNSLNEMSNFVKAGNKCGSSWYEGDLIHCYCYEFVKSVEDFKAEKEAVKQAEIIEKQSAKEKAISEASNLVLNAIEEQGEKRVRAYLEDVLVVPMSIILKEVEDVISGKRVLSASEMKSLKTYLQS